MLQLGDATSGFESVSYEHMMQQLLLDKKYHNEICLVGWECWIPKQRHN